MTAPEARLWTVLRRRALGAKFRHQHPIAPYVLDFYCAAAKLGVEVDGAAHGMGCNSQRDARRDAWLRSKGIRILRLNAEDVMRNLDGVYRLLQDACAA
jgi:very-short-patch-repair endonuclease